MINDNQMNDICMQIILNSGDVKATCEEANSLIYDGEFENAKENLFKARQLLKEAHKVHSKLITDEANGHSVEVNMLLIHAESHLTMATMCLDYTEHMLIMGKRIAQLESLVKSKEKKPFSILLTCAAGMSTSLLVERMKIAAKLQEKDYLIKAVDIDSIIDERDYDVLLVAPQIAWSITRVMKIVPKGVPVEIIPREAYISLDGADVLKVAEEAILKGGY